MPKEELVEEDKDQGELELPAVDAEEEVELEPHGRVRQEVG